jgi:hypothetical protein
MPQPILDASEAGWHASTKAVVTAVGRGRDFLRFCLQGEINGQVLRQAEYFVTLGLGKNDRGAAAAIAPQPPRGSDGKRVMADLGAHKPISPDKLCVRQKSCSGATVNLQQIVAELKAERDRLDRVIAAVSGVSTQPRRGRPPQALQTSARPKRRRRMSAAARRKLSRLLKQRWAQGKMKPRVSAKPAQTSKPARRVSRAARKRMAAAQRARWAKVRAQQQAQTKAA